MYTYTYGNCIPQVLEAVKATGTPVILVLSNGGALAIDNLIEGPNAIVEVFNPSVEGRRCFAGTLFGQHNGRGKLPVTMYPHGYIQQTPMTHQTMAKCT